MKTLKKIWNELPMKSDKGNLHSYLDVYEEILAPYRNTAKNILELGLLNGASLLLFEQYFTGNVYGVDYDSQPLDGLGDLRPLIIEGHNILIFDATDSERVNGVFNRFKFDVIIEDCNHSIEQQLGLYNLYKKFLADGGIYIIEDIQDIDKDRAVFENIDTEKYVSIIDRRSINNRYDDVLCVIQDKNTIA